MVNKLRSSVSGDVGLDFIGKGKFTLALSAVLVAIGIASIVARGKGILDIDFAGGSSVQFRVSEQTPADRIREIVKPEMKQDGEDLPYTVNGVSIAGIPEETVYKVDSSFDSVDKLKAAVAKAFQADPAVNLVTYRVKITPAENRIDQSSNSGPTNGIMLTAARAQQETPAEGDSPPSADENAADAAASDGAGSDQPAFVPGSVKSSSIIELGIEGQVDGDAAINGATLTEVLIAAAEAVNAKKADGVNDVALTERTIELKPMGEGSEEWKPDSSLPFSKWQVDLGLPAADADKVMSQIESSLGSDPVWISSSSVGARVAGDMIGRAFGALFASLICIIGYIWFRFQRVLYGFAAVAALLHDVLITLGAIAVSYWLATALGFLLIDPFKISLTVVAAILTIIGYSLNDTIVVFDRIRETKGKAPKLTGEMINTSINQTLSRTLLTSLTTLIVVLLLYCFGGEGIHAFAFALVVGVIAGTYSSIFIASPILLWLIERGDRPKTA